MENLKIINSIINLTLIIKSILTKIIHITRSAGGREIRLLEYN